LEQCLPVLLDLLAEMDPASMVPVEDTAAGNTFDPSVWKYRYVLAVLRIAEVVPTAGHMLLSKGKAGNIGILKMACSAGRMAYCDAIGEVASARTPYLSMRITRVLMRRYVLDGCESRSPARDAACGELRARVRDLCRSDRGPRFNSFERECGRFIGYRLASSEDCDARYIDERLDVLNESPQAALDSFDVTACIQQSRYQLAVVGAKLLVAVLSSGRSKDDRSTARWQRATPTVHCKAVVDAMRQQLVAAKSLPVISQDKATSAAREELSICVPKLLHAVSNLDPERFFGKSRRATTEFLVYTAARISLWVPMLGDKLLQIASGDPGVLTLSCSPSRLHFCLAMLHSPAAAGKTSVRGHAEGIVFKWYQSSCHGSGSKKFAECLIIQALVLNRCLPPAGVLDMCDEWLAMIPVLPPGDQLVHVFEDDDYDTLIVDIDE